MRAVTRSSPNQWTTTGNLQAAPCLLYTSDAADERSSVDLGGRRIIQKKKKQIRIKKKDMHTRKQEIAHTTKTMIKGDQE